MPRILEICVDSLESAIKAELGGANRIELCSTLCLGGLTPSIGLLKLVRKHLAIPIFCMLRLRHDNFVYTEMEIRVLLEDLHAFKEAGADGFVFGALTQDGRVDEESCKMIINEASPLPVTFHRAFDCSPTIHWKENLNKIISLGFSRLLTSGLAPKAEEGIEIIREIVQEAHGRMRIMIGSGIDERNVGYLIESVGYVDTIEYHGSASEQSQINPTPTIPPHSVYHSPYPLKTTRVEKVRKMRATLDEPRRWD